MVSSSAVDLWTVIFGQLSVIELLDAYSGVTRAVIFDTLQSYSEFCILFFTNSSIIEFLIRFVI